MTAAPPTPIRLAGLLVALQGAVAVGYAVFVVGRHVAGENSGAISWFGTVAYFVLLGGAVLVAGLCLLRGFRWGRGVAIVVELLLLPVAWSLLTDSQQKPLGYAVGASAIAVFALLLSPKALDWANAEY